MENSQEKSLKTTPFTLKLANGKFVNGDAYVDKTKSFRQVKKEIFENEKGSKC